MKKVVLISILISLVIIYGYKSFNRKSEHDDAKPIKRSVSIKEAIDKVVSNLKNIKGAKDPDKPRERIALYFKDDSIIEGDLIEETDESYLVDWKGSEFSVSKNQIKDVKYGKDIIASKEVLSDEEITEYWPFKNKVVIRLTNRQVLDAKITKVLPETIVLSYSLDGGGFIEQEVERERIEYLIFKPVENPETERIKNKLEELFPDMEFYKEGGFTIITDSYDTWVKKYKNALREVYTSIYLEFFDLFKDRSPMVDNFVVIFDDYMDFFEYAITDGVPGWAVAGYFSPTQKILYLFNVLGDRFSELLFEGLVGESGRTIDDIVERVEGHVDTRYHVFVEGQAQAIKDRFWEAYNYYKSIYRESTMNTLRHEFAHEIFNNYGLQGVILSKFQKDESALIKKKKEFLKEKDYKKKARLIRSLISVKDQPLDMRAANSWLAEGTATYCETSILGNQNDRWLFIYQDMKRKGPIFPLESLTYYKIGSFPGVAPFAMLQMYAQSWAFVHFLMNRYPKEFAQYQIRMAKETAEEDQDIRWLTEAIGKDIKTIEKEFIEYMDRFDEVEDPYVKSFDRLISIMQD